MESVSGVMTGCVLLPLRNDHHLLTPPRHKPPPAATCRHAQNAMGHGQSPPLLS